MVTKSKLQHYLQAKARDMLKICGVYGNYKGRSRTKE